MVVKRRGIRLKQLSPDDASLQELLDSDLCLPDDPDDPAFAEPAEAAEPEGPALADIAREVLEGLRETLAVLNPSGPAEGEPSGVTPGRSDDR